MEEQWGKYRLERPLGRGGMAEVFKASIVGPAGFHKAVCLKRIRPEFSGDKEFSGMFEAEARIAATLQHPNIVQVFDFERHEGQLLLTMEYVDGLDLRHVLAFAQRIGLRVPVGFALHVLSGLLAALGHAHGRTLGGAPRPVIHRDVSPHNILLSGDGIVKLADFGIAKAAGLSHVTRTGVIKGKLAYLSPEQLHGQEVGPETDLYGVGLVLWEMLAGQRYLPNTENAEAVLKAQDAPFRPLPEVVSGLNQIAARLLARRPEDRYSTAQAVQDEIDALGVKPANSQAAGKLVHEIGAMRESAAPIQLGQQPLSARQRVSPDAPTRAQNAPASVPPARNKPQISPAVLKAIALGVALVILAAIAVAVILKARAERAQPAVVSVLPSGYSPPTTPLPTGQGQGPLPDIVLLSTAEPKVSFGQEPEPSPRVSASPGVAQRARQPGFITVNVRPWAQVMVDEADRGTTPLTLFKVEQGAHTVRLVNAAANYDELIKVTVRAGETTKINRSIAVPSAQKASQ